MTNYQRTANWLKACGKQPGNEAHFSVQLGCHLEESVVEFFQTIEANLNEVQNAELLAAIQTIHGLSLSLKSGIVLARIADRQREDFLDALCDCEVTGNGLAYLSGLDKDGADQEVLRSNESKLVDGRAIFHPGGKIAKGPGYTAPNLAPYL